MPRFNGADYARPRDDERLSAQYARIFAFVSDEKWHTLPEISAATGDRSPSVSAQLRHMRKARFGSHTIEREYIADGLYRYRFLRNLGI